MRYYITKLVGNTTHHVHRTGSQSYTMKALFILGVFLPFLSRAFEPKLLRLTKHQHAPLVKQTYQFVPLRCVGDEDEMDKLVDLNGSAPKPNFDGEGLAGYLAPYALAMAASIAVTAAFVKFVLLDY